METKEKLLKGMILLTALPAFNSCNADTGSSPRAISAGILAEKYAISVEAARREFDGKELVVKGYVSDSIALPKDDVSEGVALLGSDKRTPLRVQCWFSRYEAAEFKGVEPGDPVTVRGIFNGESGLVLKFCKLLHEDQ
jgi:hypothetical protein